jgi:hypothetical protein
MSRLKLKVNNCLLNNKEFFKLFNSIFNKIGYNCFIIFQDYLNIKILKYDESFEMLWNFESFEMLWNFWKFWNFINFEIYKSNKKFMKFFKFWIFWKFWIFIWNFWIFLKFWIFWKFWPFLQFDWPTGNEISSLVGQRWNTE